MNPKRPALQPREHRPSQPPVQPQHQEARTPAATSSAAPASAVANQGQSKPRGPQARPVDLGLGLLPLRLFLGATFVYAGLDKILTPGFLRDAGPGSIGSQLDAFVKVSPLAPFIDVFGKPFAVEVGLLIALAELAIGIGALTGLLFRLSAAGGAAISLLFWLTASWATKPYYFGPDLPYAMGWLTLAIVGHGGRYALEWPAVAATRPSRAGAGYARSAAPIRSGRGPAEPQSPERRHILQAAAIGGGALALAAAGFLSPWRGEVSGAESENAAATSSGDGLTGLADPGAAAAIGGPTASADAGGGTAAAPSPSATPASTGTSIARLAQLAPRQALEFTDPQSGDPAVLIRLADGKVVAYDTVCTHAGCTVGYDSGSGLLLCPCHGAAFDPAHKAAVLNGPTNQPLLALPLVIDQKTGTIQLAAGA